MKVSDVIINCLEAEGVEYVFGIVGTEMLDLAHSLSKSTQIQYVNVRHEQGAAFMADVYGRLAKKAGVCLSTLGPGATNLLTGIASAKLDHSPVIALIGQADVERNHPESHQYLDIVKLLRTGNKVEHANHGFTDRTDSDTKGVQNGANGEAWFCRDCCTRELFTTKNHQ